MSYERLSLNDASIIASYAEHIQRYEFALQYCRGKRVLDADAAPDTAHIFWRQTAQSLCSRWIFLTKR